MKSSNRKEGSIDKKRYVFFSDPDVIAKRAETSAVAAQITRELEAQQKTFKEHAADLRVPARGIKCLENLLSYYPVQPYPFTFISAVKQKLALEDRIDIGAKAHDSSSQAKSLTSSILKAASTQSLNTRNQRVQKMDFIKPLKVPDLKISPKTLDFSSRESSVSKELPSIKSEIAAMDVVHDRSDKSLRTGERVQRKLDFSSDGSSFITSESIEPLKAPNVSISSNLSKKKEHGRDSSREKENRSKRMKKDDSSCAKRDESMQDQVKRSRSPRRVSRKDVRDMGNTNVPKNDRPFLTAKSNDFSSVKSKDKNFVASIGKKDDKRQKPFNAQSVELTKDTLLESKIRMSSNESSNFPVFPSWEVLDKVAVRDNMGVLSSTENKSKDMSHYFLKQKSEMEDVKYKSDSDSRQLKEDKLSIICKDQTKRVSDKNKMLNNQGEDNKLHSVNSEPSEDVEFMSETNSSRSRISAYPISSTHASKSKDLETAVEGKQSINSAGSSKTSENVKYTEHSVAQSASTSVKKDEESCSQSIITTKEIATNDDSNDVDDSTLPEALFDSRRISLREGYSQPEFHNLMTPERMNLVFKSKRRRYLMQNNDSEVDARCPKYKPTVKSEKEQEEVELIHPTALHMQFQAELHLYDSCNESLRQIMDVEKCLYNTKCEMQEQKNLQKIDKKDEEEVAQIVEDRAATTIDNDAVEKTTWNLTDYVEKKANQGNVDEGYGFNCGKFNKAVVKVAEVQTQTVNDIATQTDISANERNVQNRLSEMRENPYEPFLRRNEMSQLPVSSAIQFEDLDQIEEMSRPSRMRTMSEISLHETTSSIKTETGTEISISTRDVTCSFNKVIDSQIARLLRDENQLSYQIKEWLKVREKTLSDKTKKLVQLEEQKRALKDTGQDSRSVKKKQRALLLKLLEEKDEILKFKLFHELTSLERKRMFEKQRGMFNPQMSTKNILTKLKKIADSQSPRRLSGPMKGYDIRSNSSMSSLIDSDKSQHDRSQIDTRLNVSESDASKIEYSKPNILISLSEGNNTSAARLDELVESKEQKKCPTQLQRKSDMSKYKLRSRKYEDKMPRADILRQKQNQLDMESKRIHPMKINIRLLENQDQIRLSQSPRLEVDASVPDYVKSESDTITLVEALRISEAKRSRTSQVTDPSIQTATTAKGKESTSNAATANSESIEEEMVQDTVSKTTQSHISEISQASTSKNSKKIDKSITSDRDISKKFQPNVELKTSSKRKNSKYQKTKSVSSISSENISRSKSSSHISEELIELYNKRTRVENALLQLDNNKESSILDESDFNESQTSLQALVKHSKAKDKSSKLSTANENKGNRSAQASNRKFENDQSLSRNERDTQDASTSQISTFAVSHHSSRESEKNLSRSIVVRSQDRECEQILNARETDLASRKNCVEDWMAWHARLRAEEDRVIRMEKAAFKLVAASNVLYQQGGDTTLSSDTSDVEGRIGLLTEKLAERRLEMARLKREVKKQTKKRLRALEANLQTQIKKYDTTIHEMRKKLESKKATKETDKLAIEPKSLADFKVPEIPLKRIQDIYKSSDLLRSRSESDLLLTRNQQKDLSKHERDSYQKFMTSENIKGANVFALKDTTDPNDSARTILDDYTSTKAYDKIRTVPSTSSTSNDARSEKQIGESTADIKQTSVSYGEENAKIDSSTVQSELEVQTISDARFEDHSTINTESADDRLNTNVDQSLPKTPTILSEIPEISNVEYSKSIPSKSEYSTENVARVTNSNILTYSRKLDFLQLNNKNLSEDISSLEKDIKALSEIMSRLSNESNEKSRADDERNTSQDISEIISKSVFSDQIIDIENKERQAVLPEKKVDTESPMSVNNKTSIASNDFSHDKYISDRISSEISAIIPEEAPTISNLSHEIDYEAKSREIMNEIEKSILSQHIKIASGDNQTSALEDGNEELLNDLVSELDIKSISEILSKVSESRKSLGLAKTTATQIVDDSKKSINEQCDLSEAILEKDLVKARTKGAHSLGLAEHFSTISMQSPIIAGHRSKETISQGDSRSAPSLASSQSSHVVAKDLKSSRNILEAEVRIDAADDVKISEDLDEDIHTKVLDSTVNSMTLASNTDQNQSRTVSAGNISQDKDDWTTSDSFVVPQDEISTGVRENIENSKSGLDDTLNNFSEKNVSRVDDMTNQEAESNLIRDSDVSVFLPKGESTNVAVQDVTFNDALAQSHMVKSHDELDDILDIIARENDKRKSIPGGEKLDNVMSDSMAELLDRVKDIVEKDGKNVDSHFKGLLCDMDININRTEAVSEASILNNKAQSEINVEGISESNAASMSTCKDKEAGNREEIIDGSLRTVDDKSAINVNLYVEIDNEESPREAVSEVQEIIITELDSSSAEDNVLSELEIDAKVELAEEEESCNVNEDENECVVAENKGAVPVEIKECLESISEQDSSDGEQLDNLVEVAVSGLDTVEKPVASSRDSPEPIIDDAAQTGRAEEETTDDTAEKTNETAISDAPVVGNINKTFDVLKDPEYEDISEESLEVSEILDKDDFPRTGAAKKAANLPERYQTIQKSEDVLRILDEITQKSSFDSVASNSQNNERSDQSAPSVTEEISEASGAEVSAEDDGSSPEMNRTTNRLEEESYEVDETKGRFLEKAKLQDRQSVEANDADGLSEGKAVSWRLNEDDKSRIIYELRERVSQLQEQNGSSESSEAGDTPRGVSEIEMDSPRDFNDSRLDIDILDDDLLSGTKATKQSIDMETNFHSASIVTTSDKDIEAMIYELKASVGQPGQDVAELEAKLLRIQQLQIELEIKKLEAEEVSYYVREIPNKPPPPYTPPGDGRLSASLSSPSLVTAVIPSNVEELTSFTEKATTLIYKAKLAGEDIANLEAPPEIYDVTKDKSERRDRRIYNTFLFDLCKETIVEVYRAEYEKPGPSWTKPNVKIKPTMKIPKNVEELIEYVNKEVATLFGFKTKLQRENMVMRWSRKRRDRVDELLAREAQAEEDEWTKFHHDELAVKNGLTVAILDTLVMETANVMKMAYGKKRRMMV
ncbi:centrosome-associated protein 350-like isoform X1 [Temnothorax curvispinosus]|uniref:Centrosome-associated protein 350-like isoform X1 n=1 Tax=Temnothorax curvispinosus TaxID=300111 RepID=A0A6J1QLG8_9HYME|nr:centrosome-associated protein 350-like isoform X1 [Temnothorax curvispinosus]